VLDHVGERLLDDPVRRQVDARGTGDLSRDLKADKDPAPLVR